MFSKSFFANVYFANFYWENAGATPTTRTGGAAVPVRGWNGREYWDGNQRGNVETIYRSRTVRLTPTPVEIDLRVSAKLHTYLPETIRPGLHTEIPAIPKPQPRIWPPLRCQPLHPLLLSVSAELSRVAPEVTWRARISEKAEQASSLEQQLKEARKSISWLQKELAEATEEVIDLEDMLLLGVR